MAKKPQRKKKMIAKSTKVPVKPPATSRLALVFRENIKARIELLGITQNEVANRLSVSKSEISHVLRGSYEPTLRRVEQFAIALQCEAADLLLDKEAWEIC